MKKVLSIILALCMLSLGVPFAMASDCYTANFEISGGNATITTYTTSDYTSGGETNQTSAVARDSSTGEIDVSGSGQINFTVVPEDGYTVSGVTVTGSYKNLKAPSDTGLENTWRITKVASDLTVTVTLEKSAEEEETGDPVITFADSAVSTTGSKTGITVSGTDVTISAEGTYTFEGSCSDGTITVAKNAGAVTLILNGLTLTSTTSAPIACKGSTDVTIFAAEGTTNVLTDAYREGASPKACINSAANLILDGTGSLTVNGNNKNGIKADGNVTINNLTLTVNSLDNSIAADNILTINSGNITAISAEGDCIKSNPDEITDETLGCVVINGGTLNLQATANDGVSALSTLVINGGNFTIKTASGSGSVVSESDDLSLKGIKAEGNLTINAGTFNFNTADDAVHSNSDVTINGGTFTIATGDDGIHADSTVTIANGTIDITTCYEGIEGENITIKDGDINVVASDDGINISGGNDSSGNGGAFGGWSQSSTTAGTLTINGGTIVVNSNGDGLDSNGSIAMTDGTVVVFGPTSNGDGAIDYDGSFTISGGTLLAIGASGMAQSPTGNGVGVVSSNLNGSATTVAVLDKNGNPIIAVKSPKSFGNIVVASSTISSGDSVTVVTGATISGDSSNGVYTGNVSISGGTSTTISASNGGNNGGFGPGNNGGDNGGMNGASSFLQRIKDFFQKIINWFRNIFSIG